jgi:hypothetical protein
MQRSAQAEETQNNDDNHHEADDVDDLVHVLSVF